MKRLKNISLLLLMVASLIVPTFGSAIVAYAAEAPIATVGAEITIIQMPSTGEIGTSLNIPKGSSTDGTVTVTVTDPKGAAVTLTDAGSTYSFNPSFAGTYKAQYAVISADENVLASTYSKLYSIVVSGDKPVFDFDTNSNILLPNTTNYDYEIVIPYPTVYGSDGQEVALADVANDIVITVKNPNAQTIVLGTKAIGGINYYTFTPLQADGEGVYTIDYYYVDASNLNVRQTEEMVVAESFDPSDIELSYSLSGSMPESAVLGNKLSLPNVVTRDQNAGNVLLNTYIEVTATFLNEEVADVVYNVEDFAFTPSHEGDYEIVYKVYDFFGLITDETIGEYTYSLKNVEDTEAPVVMPVSNYTENLMDDSEYEFVNVSYDIPSNIAVGTTVYFPAIHAVDNYSLSSNLTYKRAVINANNTITDLDHITENAYAYWEQVPYTFLTEGTYTVKYYATDEAGNERTVSYTLKVVDGFVDNEAPRVTLPSIPTYVKEGSVIKFLKPTAVDYVSATSTSTVDTRLELKTYFYMGDNTGLMVEITEDEGDSNYLSFIVPVGLGEDYLHIYIEATDDGLNASSQVNVGTKTKKVYLLDTSDDIAPALTGDAPVIVAQDQGTVVNIPTVKFTDADPMFTTVSVQVVNPNGTNVSVSGLQLEFELDTLSGFDADGIKVAAGRFTATLAGNYRITYTATDVANNSYVVSYVQYINDTQAPSFQIDSLNSNLETGETITLPTPVIMDNGVEIENQALTSIVFIDSPAYSLNIATYEFTPLEEGTYTFKYVAEDEYGNTSESAVYSLVASDTIDPVITLNDEVPFPLTYALTRANENDPYDSVVIPDFTASDEFNGIKEYSISVKNPSGTVILNEKNGATASNGTYSFVPTVDGSYIVTYKAVDLAGNTVTDVRTVKVGDTAAPVLTIGNTSANKPGNQKLNSTITLDLSAITINDVKDGDILTDDKTTGGQNKFTVVLTAPDGTTVSPTEAGTYTYNLTQSGDYTLTYTARDEAGNQKVESTVFQVVADEAGVITLTQTLGIVFIIIAALALVGVVIYFIRSREIIDEKE